MTEDRIYLCLHLCLILYCILLIHGYSITGLIEFYFDLMVLDKIMAVATVNVVAYLVAHCN